MDKQKNAAASEGTAERLVGLVEVAYSQGWRDGMEREASGGNDSPDWNEGESWCESDIRRQLKEIENEIESNDEVSLRR